MGVKDFLRRFAPQKRAVAAIRALCAQAGKNRISTRVIDREIRAYRRERAL
jgi:hypothetical protein